MNTTPATTPDALLREAGNAIGRAEATLLLAHASGRSATWLLAHGDAALPRTTCEDFAALVRRRIEGVPVAYLVGHKAFWTLHLKVTPDTLVPRPETERLVELALDKLPPERAARVLDLGTGSGAIALAIATERPLARVLATDASAAALAVARDNARTHAIGNVDFVHGNWLAAVTGQRFDLIVSNPPYVAAGDPHLARGDLRFEPLTALASGQDGLRDLAQIIGDAPSQLLPGAWLLLEHGWDQGAAVRALLAQAGFQQTSTATDLEHRDRVSLGRAPC